MASEIRVDKITSLSGVGTITPSSSGIDITGITTIATLKATTGIVTTLTATTGIVTTLTANTITSVDSTESNSATTGAVKIAGGLGVVKNIYTSGAAYVQGSGGLTVTNDVSISDKIIHTGDTDTTIRFPSADTIRFDTGGTEAARITSEQKFVIGDTNSTAQLGVVRASYNLAEFTNTNADATGAELSLRKDSASPADNDGLGSLNFIGDNDAGQKTTYAYIQSKSTDVSDGTEDGTLRFNTRGGGTLSTRLRITGTGDIKIGDQATASGALRYLDVQNSDSSSASSGAILRLISSNQAQNSTTSVDLAKYRDGAFYINNNETHSGAVTVFNIGGSEIARFTTGGLAIGGTGTANTLVDYEEGTFTMHFSVEGQSNMTMSGRVGIYTKIGRVVHIIGGGQVAENPPGGRSTSAAIQFTNLPFTSKQLNTGTAGLPFSVNTQGLDSTGLGQLAGSQPYQFNGRLFDNSTNGRIIAYKGDGDQNPQNASLALVYNSQIYVMFSYVTDS